jgi:hypothetical protein
MRLCDDADQGARCGEAEQLRAAPGEVEALAGLLRRHVGGLADALGGDRGLGHPRDVLADLSLKDDRDGAIRH